MNTEPKVDFLPLITLVVMCASTAVEVPVSAGESSLCFAECRSSLTAAMDVLVLPRIKLVIANDNHHYSGGPEDDDEPVVERIR